LPTRTDDARDPLMWNAAHACALRWGRAFARHQYCGAAGRRCKHSCLAIRLTICIAL